MRFLHIADAHLDTAFAGRSEDIRRRLRRASREAFERMVSTAVSERVDAVIIAGDLFDGDRLSFETERFLLDQLTTLTEAGVRVVYATGNHDPGRLRVRSGSLEWPRGVTIIPDARPRTVPIPGRAGYPVGYVTGAGHASSRETTDLARELSPSDAPLPQVAVLHTQVTRANGSDVHKPYAPSELEFLRGAGFHYWALGHIHLRQTLSEEPPIHYPGNLQGRNPRETGPKGCLLVDLRDPANPGVEFRELAPVRWEKLTVSDLGDAETLEQLVRAVTDVWDAERAADPGEVDTEWMVAIDLAGPSPLWRELRQSEEVQTITDELTLRLGALEVEVRTARVHPRAHLDDHRDRQDVLGATLRLAQDIVDGTATLDVPEDALGGFNRERGQSLDSYVRQLMEGGAEEILAQMLSTDEAPE